QDTAGITLTADSSTVVTLTIKPGTGARGAVLTCDQTQGGVASTRVLSGTATFSGCAIDRPGAGYVLVATAAGLPLFETAPFNVTLAGDTNGDGRVSIADYSLVVTHFGKSMASADWRDATTRPWRADLDGDEAVDVVDHSIAVTRFGTSTTVAVAPSDPSAGP
ncbi:MAG: hypothetical protein HY691_03060, partial [Chloroflexi bacterium]|nr:hypothetical protein [Chloroflexota bacterium]